MIFDDERYIRNILLTDNKKPVREEESSRYTSFKFKFDLYNTDSKSIAYENSVSHSFDLFVASL